MHPRTITIDGTTYQWNEIVALRREQVMAQRQPQPALFELIEDRRPKSQLKASGRYEEPTLF